MGSSSCLLRAQSDAADTAGGERRLELCLLNAAISDIHPFGPGLGSRCAKSKAELKAELDL